MARPDCPLVSALALSAVLACAPLAGCTSHAHVIDQPPPPRHERVAYRPGYIWVHGHWARTGRTWAWRDGHHERARHGFVYIDGRWQETARGPVWIEGGWRRRGNAVVVRERR